MADKYKLGDAPGDVKSNIAYRYFLVVVDDANSLRTIIERKSNNQRFHMMYKTLSVANEARFKIADDPDSGYADDDLAVYDRQYQSVL